MILVHEHRFTECAHSLPEDTRNRKAQPTSNMHAARPALHMCVYTYAKCALRFRPLESRALLCEQQIVSRDDVRVPLHHNAQHRRQPLRRPGSRRMQFGRSTFTFAALHSTHSRTHTRAYTHTPVRVHSTHTHTYK